MHPVRLRGSATGVRPYGPTPPDRNNSRKTRPWHAHTGFFLNQAHPGPHCRLRYGKACRSVHLQLHRQSTVEGPVPRATSKRNRNRPRRVSRQRRTHRQLAGTRHGATIQPNRRRRYKSAEASRTAMTDASQQHPVPGLRDGVFFCPFILPRYSRRTPARPRGLSHGLDSMPQEG